MVSYQRSNTGRGLPGVGSGPRRALPGLGIGIKDDNDTANATEVMDCRDNAEQAAGIIFVVAGMAIAANVIVMFLILSRKSLRR